MSLAKQADRSNSSAEQGGGEVGRYTSQGTLSEAEWRRNAFSGAGIL